MNALNIITFLAFYLEHYCNRGFLSARGRAIQYSCTMMCMLSDLSHPYLHLYEPGDALPEDQGWPEQ